MTGLHALHMIIGIPTIAVIASLAAKGRYSPKYVFLTLTDYLSRPWPLTAAG